MENGQNPMDETKSELEGLFKDTEELLSFFNTETDERKKEEYESAIEDAFTDIEDTLSDFKSLSDTLSNAKFSDKLGSADLDSYKVYIKKSEKRISKLQKQLSEYKTIEAPNNSHSNIAYQPRKKRDLLLEDSEMNTNIFGFNDAPSSTTDKFETARQEDNDQFIQLQMQKQRDIMDHQDKKLDIISEKASTLSNILVDIDDNLKEQKKDIRHLTSDIERTTSTIKRLRNRIDRLIAGTSDKGKILCIVVLIIIIAILIIVLAVI
mmetsp:Transcript_4083/g.6044  ORF Transcript_4083/g.6044 Transcript_4083/m.6044 type:complete len:265 (+) Transcript_4083:109-903(+)